MDPVLVVLLHITRPSRISPVLLAWFGNGEENVFSFLVLSDFIPHFRPTGFCEDWLPQYIEYDFFQLFRMGRASFEQLLTKIGPAINVAFVGGEQPISAEKKLLMTLWWLGKGEVLLSIADKFNVALSAVHKNLNLVLEQIVQLQNIYIAWPNANEIPTVANDFHGRANIPGVVGAIDVCNIPFKAPEEHQYSYVDRKMQHSIKLQGICTANKIFTNILVGWPGSVHDSRIFQNCEIYRKVTNNATRTRYIPTLEHHLVGDSAYPLLDWLLTPYRDNGNLAPWQRRYNYLHSRTRIVIEHVFGILKTRWRILQYVNVNSIEKAIKIIAACCVLHNFCYTIGEVWDEFDVVLQDNDYFVGNIPNNNHAMNKRQMIAQAL